MLMMDRVAPVLGDSVVWADWLVDYSSPKLFPTACHTRIKFSYLISWEIALNSLVPETSTSSNRADSTLVRITPEKAIRSSAVR